MGSLCGRGQSEEEIDQQAYDMNLACLRLLRATPTSLWDALHHAARHEKLDDELRLLLRVFDVLHQESLLGDARFSLFEAEIGLEWRNVATGHSMYVFVMPRQVQTRWYRHGGDLVFGMTELGLDPEADTFVDDLRKSLARCKERMDHDAERKKND
jgi:hypothetical protein